MIKKTVQTIYNNAALKLKHFAGFTANELSWILVTVPEKAGQNLSTVVTFDFENTPSLSIEVMVCVIVCGQYNSKIYRLRAIYSAATSSL